MYSIRKKYPRIFSSIVPKIEALLSNTFRQHLLQLEHKWLTGSTLEDVTYSLWLADKQVAQTTPDVYSYYEALPFYDDSIGAILTPYLIQYEKNSQKTIQELFRVLKPNGYLFILGIHPLTHLKTHTLESKLDSLRRLSSAYTMGNPIKRAGGVIVERKYYFDYPILPDDSKSRFSKQWQYWMARLSPNESHYYLIIAQKKIRSAQVITLSDSIVSFATVKSNVYVKS